MASRVRVDRQGRMVLPKWLRREVVDEPGEVIASRTPEGILLSAVRSPGQVESGEDGLPVLRLGREVSNDEVLAALDEDRAAR